MIRNSAIETVVGRIAITLALLVIVLAVADKIWPGVPGEALSTRGLF